MRGPATSDGDSSAPARTAVPLADRSAVLRRHLFFREASETALERLAARARAVEIAPGKRLFNKGDPGLGLYAVLSGLIKISVQAPSEKEILLNLIGEGEVFGELALLDGEPRTADATAVTRSRLLVLDRRDFLPVLQEETALSATLLSILSRRLRRTSEQVEDLTFADIPRRIAKALLRLAEVRPPAGASGTRVEITQKELGRTLGLSRETVNRHLRAWEDAGVLRLEKGACVIVDPGYIRRLSAEPPDLA
ncbi:MAG TPA: Crp/Fnr family transcriptional regulator [Beijerinckiaceae bacterium]|nr:Crp/Fnr family transcriptional regulator [Beijerinckiaceae bacterium]